LIRVTGVGVDISYTYDPDGNRIGKTVNGTTTKYLVDTNNPTGYAQVVEELDASDTVQVVYTYGLDLISQNRHRIAGLWDKSYYGYDGTGSVRYLTDSTGTVTDNYDYDAFGNLLSKTGSTVNEYRFHGERFDEETGLYYLRARYMDPNTGRFTTMDTYAGNNNEPMSLHKYSFAGNNPVNEIDPSGNDFTLTDVSMSSAMSGILASNALVLVASVFRGVDLAAAGEFQLNAIQLGWSLNAGSRYMEAGGGVYANINVRDRKVSWGVSIEGGFNASLSNHKTAFSWSPIPEVYAIFGHSQSKASFQVAATFPIMFLKSPVIKLMVKMWKCEPLYYFMDKADKLNVMGFKSFGIGLDTAGNSLVCLSPSSGFSTNYELDIDMGDIGSWAPKPEQSAFVAKVSNSTAQSLPGDICD